MTSGRFNAETDRQKPFLLLTNMPALLTKVPNLLMEMPYLVQESPVLLQDLTELSTTMALPAHEMPFLA